MRGGVWCAQELLRGVFRHSVVAATIAHDGDDLGHTHQSAECLRQNIRAAPRVATVEPSG